MGKISHELELVFNKASKIYYGFDNSRIDCMNLLLAMATVQNYCQDILSSFGFDQTIAKSFVVDGYVAENRNITENAEKAIIRATEIAYFYGYATTCSHHLLLAIIEIDSKEVTQVLFDYALSRIRITEIVEAMRYNKIGDNDSKNKAITISKATKNKQLEKQILSALKLRNNKDN